MIIQISSVGSIYRSFSGSDREKIGSIIGNMLKLSEKKKRWLEFVWAMTQKEIISRYKMAFLGFLWIFINPLLQMLVMGFIFQFFIPIKVTNYFEFLFPGLLVWNFFSYTISKNTSIFVSERSLIRKAKFPKEAIVLSVVLSNLFHFLISLVIFILFEWLVNSKIYWWNWYLLPVVIVWLTVLTSGLSFLFSSLNVKWRDINFVVQAAMPLWFYATPIIYSLDVLPWWLGRLLSFLNPMTSVVGVLRWAVIGTSVEWLGSIFSLVMTVIIFLLGLFVFKKFEGNFEDLI